MQWAFMILAGTNLVLLALAFLYKPSGEDPAGEGMRLAFALFYAIALAAVLLLYRFVHRRGVRIALLVILTLPLLSILYGISLSLQAG